MQHTLGSPVRALLSVLLFGFFLSHVDDILMYDMHLRDLHDQAYSVILFMIVFWEKASQLHKFD